MPQFRRDPFGSSWVLISPERGLEPSDFGSAGRAQVELIAAPPGGTDVGGGVRLLESAAEPFGSGKPFRVTGDALFEQAQSSGYREVLVEHADPAMTLDAMPSEHLCRVLGRYRERLAALGRKPDIRHVQLIRNVGAVAGALYEEPHAQLLALPVPSRWLEEELSAAAAYRRAQGSCLFCDVLEAELRLRERVVSANEHFVALAPFAAKTPFEIWIFPRLHSSAFAALPESALSALASLLQKVVRAMNAALAAPPHNLLVHTLPQGDDLGYHWHIELLPRLTKQAGFDWGSGFYVNPTPPEDAARFLREALALQEVE